MSPSPKVSVIIALFNGASVIERALESLRAQTEQSWEAIVVDDRSTDAGRSVVERFQLSTGDSRIRLVPLAENGGPSRARNLGVEASLGEHIVFLDCDDLLLPNALSELLSASGADIDVVAGAHIVRTETGRETVRPDRVAGDLTGLEAVEALLQERIWNYNHGRLYRRRLLEAVTHREEVRRYEDLVFNAAAYSYCRKVRVIRTPVYLYVVSPTSATWSQELVADFVTQTEELLREGLNPQIADQVSLRSWRVMRAVLAVVVLSGALISGARADAIASLRQALNRNVGLKDLPDIFACAPRVAISAIVLRLAPGLYARAYRSYVRKRYELPE